MKYLKKILFGGFLVIGFNYFLMGNACGEEDLYSEKEALEAYKREEGVTSADLRRNGMLAKAFMSCQGVTDAELKLNRTLNQFIAQCANGIQSLDGCQLNIESACINGREVPIATDSVLAEAFKNTGFVLRKSQGFTTSDFTDGGNRMYDPVKLKNGKTTRLCNEIKDYDYNNTPELSSKLQVGVPIESNSALLKAQSGIGNLSLHTTVSFENDPSLPGGIRRDVEVELRETYQANVLNVLGNTAPYKARSSSVADAIRIIIQNNMVKCKKQENIIFPKTYDPVTGKEIPFDYSKAGGIDQSLSDEVKNEYLNGLEDLYGPGNPAGLDIAKSKKALASVLGVQYPSLMLTTDPNSETSISKVKSEKAKASR